MKYFKDIKQVGSLWIAVDNGTFYATINEITDKYNKSKIAKAIAKFWNKINPTTIALKAIINFVDDIAIIAAPSQKVLKAKIKEAEQLFNKLIIDLEQHYKKYR